MVEDRLRAAVGQPLSVADAGFLQNEIRARGVFAEIRPLASGKVVVEVEIDDYTRAMQVREQVLPSAPAQGGKSSHPNPTNTRRRLAAATTAIATFYVGRGLPPAARALGAIALGAIVYMMLGSTDSQAGGSG